MDRPTLVTPPRIRGYRLDRLLAHGPHADVWLGHDEDHADDAPLALRVVRPDAVPDEAAARRFETEARLAARVVHPNVLPLLDSGRSAEDRPWTATALQPRGDLGTRSIGHDPRRIAMLLDAVLDALAAAHRQGLVHGGIKPGNVLLDHRGLPLLTDFGLALRRGPGMRADGPAIERLAWMAPEQIADAEIDARADLYAVGLLAHTLLSGEPAWHATTAAAMARLQAESALPRLTPGLRDWQGWLDRATAKAPERRWRDAEAMRAGLARVVRRLDAGEDAIGLGRSRRWLKPLLAGSAAPVLLGAVALWWFARPATTPGDRYFRVAPGDAGLSPIGSPAAPVVGADPSAAMLQPLPSDTAPVEAALRGFEQALRVGQLDAPAGRNALSNLTTLRTLAASDARLPALARRLAEAFGARAAAAIGSADRAAALRDLESRNRALAAVGLPPAPPAGALATRLQAAVEQQLAAAAAEFDRKRAQDWATFAVSLGNPAWQATLQRRAASIPVPGEPLPGDRLGAVFVRADGRDFGITPRAVSVADYTRFANAIQRAPSLCRERASLLRLFAPRDWKNPGFAQTSDDPVVCVSVGDALAYARWISQQTGVQYRLPNATDLRAAAGVLRGSGGEWLSDCAGAGCVRHAVAGKATPARDAGRGWEDIGFRLVRDP